MLLLDVAILIARPEKRPKEMNNEKMTTPKGIALYPHLDKPDTKFDDIGVYQLSLRLAKEEGVELQNTLQEILNKHTDLIKKQTGKDPKIQPLPIKENTDAEGNEVLDFKFKLKPQLRTRSGEIIEQRPQIFDAGLKPMGKVGIGNGSTVKVSFVAAPYQAPIGAGVSLRLNAVQVIDLIQYNGGADGSGFAVEEGFAFEESKTPVLEIGGDEVTETKAASAF
jgi:hypothetical protein